MHIVSIDTQALINQLAQIGDQPASSVDGSTRPLEHHHFTTRRNANAQALLDRLEMAIVAAEEMGRIRPLLKLHLESGRTIQNEEGCFRISLSPGGGG